LSTELYLCEKPSQGRDIARVLNASQRYDGYLQGKNLIVTWCIGHLLEMLPPDAYDPRYKRWALADLPILPAHWKMQPKRSTKKQLMLIKKLLKQTNGVVIATDADREGETIAREVLEYFNFKGPVRRLWLSALDPISIKRALNAIKQSHETQALYFSGLARGRADWLIGMNLTRAFTLLANDKQVRSVGRVQTPTLALITRRDREIADFQPQAYYEIAAYFKTPAEQLLETKWIVPQTSKQQTLCQDKHVAEAVIQRCIHQIGSVSKAQTQRKKESPPLLYNLSGLQQEASRRWGYSAQDVLNTAQSLYETHKLTSYPRSDCEYLPMSQFKDVRQVLQALCQNDPAICPLINQANPAQRSRVWNDKKITAHHAIIPTQATPGLSRLNTVEFNLYNLIRRRYLAQFFPDYEYDQSTIVVNINADQFKASGRMPRVAGWKQVMESGTTRQQRNQSKGEASAQHQQLPLVHQGDELPCDRLERLDKLTNPPKHFTEGTLIKAMETIGSQVTDTVLKKVLKETAGIGTQATRAGIIQTLLQRKFIKREKKSIKATPLGFTLIDALPEMLKDAALTAQWEQQLDEIAHNQTANPDTLVTTFLQQQVNLLGSIIYQLKHPHKVSAPQAASYQAGDPCPQCGQQLEIRIAIRGSKTGQNYIGCSHFPDCRFYYWPPA